MPSFFLDTFPVINVMTLSCSYPAAARRYCINIHNYNVYVFVLQYMHTQLNTDLALSYDTRCALIQFCRKFGRMLPNKWNLSSCIHHILLVLVLATTSQQGWKANMWSLLDVPTKQYTPPKSSKHFTKTPVTGKQISSWQPAHTIIWTISLYVGS